MGAALALAAFDAARWHGFDGASTRALVRMALSALDDDPRPVYYGGWEAIAAAIGRTVDPDDARSIRAAKEAVRMAMKPLTAVSVAEVTQRAAPGRNARYGLHLTVQAEPAPSAPATVQAEPGNGTGSARQTIQAQPVPEEKEEERGGPRASAPPLCPRHPNGNTSEPCRTCGDVRRARAALPTVSGLQTVTRERCAPGAHHLVGDGTCTLCTARAHDIAAEPIPSAYVGAAT